MKLLASLFLIAACGGSDKPATTPTPATAAPPADALAAQIERGGKLFGANCAKCHGDAGQGTAKGPPVVGKEAFPLKPREGAKRDVEFRTAADVFTWTTVHMPGDAPGTLETDEYLAIFAFDLTANGVKLSAPLDGPAAAAIVLHP
ncbi:MAG: c-type cytochrome [Kofleriaceae bacterium]